MLGNLKGWHIILVLAVVLILFGAPKLPEFARNLGKSLNILKEETQNLRDPKPEESGKAAAEGEVKPSKEARDD